MNTRTKTVELWCDLWPGWHDADPPCVHITSLPAIEKMPGNKRIKITVELPCFGGSADVDEAVQATAVLQ